MDSICCCCGNTSTVSHSTTRGTDLVSCMMCSRQQQNTYHTCVSNMSCRMPHQCVPQHHTLDIRAAAGSSRPHIMGTSATRRMAAPALCPTAPHAGQTCSKQQQATHHTPAPHAGQTCCCYSTSTVSHGTTRGTDLQQAAAGHTIHALDRPTQHSALIKDDRRCDTVGC
jgi:hypothetical protein